MKRIEIILASGSPRRSQLLREAGFMIIVSPPDISETYPDSLKPEEIPQYLARKKAEALELTLSESQCILSADSIVVKGGEILGKPQDQDEAREMLQQLSADEHRVISGVCIRSSQEMALFAVTTTVQFDEIESWEIEYYLDHFKPYDKAGAYGIQEWLGHCKVKSLEGSYTNVMGLPVRETYRAMGKLFGNI